jgi:poly(3-hydroxybutyrate) depolymerase
VLCLHGALGNGSTFYGAGFLQYDATDVYVAYLYGSEVIVGFPTLYPSQKRWNDTQDHVASDDVAYIMAVINHYKALGVTDFYLAGHSNGASMAYTFLATHPEDIRGALCASGYWRDAPDNAMVAVPGSAKIIHVHGDGDAVVPIAGLVYPEITYTMAANTAIFRAAGHNVMEYVVAGAVHTFSDIDAKAIRPMRDFVDFLVNA